MRLHASHACAQHFRESHTPAQFKDSGNSHSPAAKRHSISVSTAAHSRAHTRTSI